MNNLGTFYRICDFKQSRSWLWQLPVFSSNGNSPTFWQWIWHSIQRSDIWLSSKFRKNKWDWKKSSFHLDSRRRQSSSSLKEWYRKRVPCLCTNKKSSSIQKIMEFWRRNYRNRQKKDQWIFNQLYLFSYSELRKLIGVISDDNFFFNGTLKENISWNVHHFDEFQADLFAQELQIE